MTRDEGLKCVRVRYFIPFLEVLISRGEKHLRVSSCGASFKRQPPPNLRQEIKGGASHDGPDMRANGGDSRARWRQMIA